MAKQIIILGMHRSGTSLVTNIVRQMGAWVGKEESLLDAAQDNPKGFWERRDVMEINDALLHAAGATWCSVADLNPESIARDSRETCMHQMHTIIQELDTHAPWVIKDPRMCIVLPVWRSLLKDAVYIIVSRSPVEIAASLKTRNQLPMNYSIALWEFYMLAALKESAASARVLISYSDLLRDPGKTVAHFFNDLSDAGVVGLKQLYNDTLAAIVEKRLYRSQMEESSALSYLNVKQMHVFKSLENKRCLAWQEVPGLSEGARDVLHYYQNTLKVLEEKKELIHLITQLNLDNNRPCDSRQYKFGRLLGALCPGILRGLQRTPLQERQIRALFEKYKKNEGQNGGK